MSLNVATPAAQFSQHPPAQFGTVVGKFDGMVQLNGPKDEPHARMDVNVGDGGPDVEADANTQSQDGSQVLVAEKDEVVPSMPAPGIYSGDRESYAADGLTSSNFQPMSASDLNAKMTNLAQSSQEVAFTGRLYNDPPKGGQPAKRGVDLLHDNSDDPTRSRQPDGDSQFYYTQNGQIHRDTVYVMFQTDKPLGGGPGSTVDTQA